MCANKLQPKSAGQKSAKRPSVLLALQRKYTEPLHRLQLQLQRRMQLLTQVTHTVAKSKLYLHLIHYFNKLCCFLPDAASPVFC